MNLHPLMDNPFLRIILMPFLLSNFVAQNNLLRIEASISATISISISCEDYAPDDGMDQVGITGVFLPLIFWCLKTGENGGFGMLYLVGFNTDVKTPLHPHPIPSIPHRHFLPDFPYEKPDRHHLHDPCRSSWKCGGVRFEYFRPET